MHAEFTKSLKNFILF